MVAKTPGHVAAYGPDHERRDKERHPSLPEEVDQGHENKFRHHQQASHLAENREACVEVSGKKQRPGDDASPEPPDELVTRLPEHVPAEQYAGREKVEGSQSRSNGTAEREVAPHIGEKKGRHGRSGSFGRISRSVVRVDDDAAINGATLDALGLVMRAEALGALLRFDDVDVVALGTSG